MGWLLLQEIEVFFAFGGGIFLILAALAFPCLLIGLFACGVGLSLCSYWFISVPPVRGGTYFSLPAAKKSRQKKAALHRQFLSGSPGLELRITHICAGIALVNSARRC